MSLLLAFAVTLFIAVLLSELASRSVLSSAVLFLIAGFILGEWVPNAGRFDANSPIISRLADLALFSVLFTDGMKLSLRDVLAHWKLPGRALGLGLPLTLLAMAAAAHYIVGFSWLESMLIGAVLSPTDPVFAAAIVGREEIPHRVRHLLNIESGLNDGLALPIVLVLVAVLGHEQPHIGELMTEVGAGVALGLVLPWLAIQLEKSRLFAVVEHFEPLFAFSIGLLLYAIAILTRANEYLAAFAGGVTIATFRPGLRDEFQRFGEHVTELLKLAALLAFGTLMSIAFFRNLAWSDLAFVLIALLVARPMSVALALARTDLDWRQRIVAAWFGPKGFASVVYGIIVLKSGLARGDDMFHLIAVVIVGSMVAHSSTDVLLARWFCRVEPEKVPA